MDKLYKGVGDFFAFAKKKGLDILTGADLFGIQWSGFEFSRMSKKDMYQGVVYACIDLIAQRASALNYAIVQKQSGDETYILDPDDKKIEKHEILDLLKKPNELQSSSAFLYLMYAHFATFNEVFILPVGNLDGTRTVQLLLLNPDHMLIEKGTSNYKPVERYRYSYGGMNATFEPHQLIHIFKPNPFDEYRGVSPLTMARHDIEGEISAKKWNAKFFVNGGSPSGIFKVATNDKPTFEMMEQKIREKYAGIDNAFKFFVLNKDSDFTPITPSQRDMQFVEMQNMSEKRIHKIFKVPSIFLGSTDEAKYSNVWAAKMIFNEVVIEPMVRMAFEGLNNYLLEKEQDKRLKFENPVPEDFEYKLKKQEQDRLDSHEQTTYLTIDERREQEGFKPLPNGEGATLYEGYIARLSSNNQVNPGEKEVKKKVSP